MAAGFRIRANRVIAQSDIVLEIVDARFPQETRNPGLEKKVIAAEKGLVVVINKSDLVGSDKAKKIKQSIGKEFPCVFVSTKGRIGRKKLMEEIGKLGTGTKIKVGLMGYPNTGKSSVINMLKGRKAARTSKKAGFTRGEQFVRLSERISLIDSPGVIPIGERDEFRLFLVGAKNPQDVKDTELAAIKLIEFLCREKPNALKKRYGVGETGDPEKVLEEIAVNRKTLLKGGKPDIETAARIVLEEWRKNILG